MFYCDPQNGIISTVSYAHIKSQGLFSNRISNNLISLEFLPSECGQFKEVDKLSNQILMSVSFKQKPDLYGIITKNNIQELTLKLNIAVGTLPSQELIIRFSEYKPGLINPSNIFEIRSIPSTITKLNIQHCLFKHNIKIIPDSVTDLKVSDWNLSIVEEGSLPSSPSIRTLVLEIDGGGYREYSENIKEKKWPSQFFPPNLNVFKVIGRTEDSVIELFIGGGSQELTEVLLPSKLQSVTFDNFPLIDWNYKLSIPNSLQHLVIQYFKEEDYEPVINFKNFIN
eukprot:gene940-1191_t